MIEKILGRLEEAKFPITDLKDGVKVNGIQATDDAVLYAKAIEIVQEVAKEYEGRMIEFPCKVGDTVYEFLITGVENHEPVYEIYEAKVIRFIRDSFYWCCETITKDKNEWRYEFVVDTFGKTVFLTRSEAEEALAKGGK